jgi:serine/threonine-protein kinase
MPAGPKLGRYELLARIATGGMGEIFLSRLEGAAGFEKLCVVKRILPHLADDSRFRSMLIAEAQIAANMSHANICHVYELDESDHQLYMAMEYLEGVTLLELLRAVSGRGGYLDLGFIAGVVQQACEGLHYAHELRDRDGKSLGVVHRDVTPSNLFLTESGMVKIVDFGIAKVKDAAVTDSGTVKGKYAYMAPEQLRGQAIDRRVDVFSLGVIVFEMVTCRRLYQRKTDYLTFRAVMEPPRLEPVRYRTDVPDALIPVLSRALHRDRNARYPTVRQLATALGEALGAIRPWSQGDIGELVRTMFADDIRMHNAEISKVVKRTERDPSQPIPVIARRTPLPDDSDYFSFETSQTEEPPAAAEASSAGASTFSDSSDDGSGAPSTTPSSGAPAPSTGPALQAPKLPSAPGATGALSIAAILGAAAAVLVAGLFAIERASTRRAAARRVAPLAAAATGAAGAGTDHARGDHTRRRPAGPYGAALGSHERELDQCARDNSEPWPADARAVIVVGLDGRAKQVALRPDSVERTRLGSCIRGVLQVVAFPAAPDEKQVALGLALSRER